jgi:DNA-binding Lrp family transcriptional regulator
MSAKDIVLMAHLRSNSRETLTKMSRSTRIPISTLYDKLKQHEKGLIQKHTCLVDFTKLGFNTKVNILIKVERELREEVKNFLVKDFNVNSVYKINSGYDFMVEGIFKHIKDMEDFLERLDEKFKLKEKQVYYVIEDIKREGFMADPQTVSLLLQEPSRGQEVR